MTIDSVKFIAMINDLQTNEDIEARSYSGRGMYGDSCVGVTCDNPFAVVAGLAFAAGQDVAEENYSLAQDILQALEGTRQDSMGRSTIIYWPSIKWVETEVPEGSGDFECYRRPFESNAGRTCVEMFPAVEENWCDGCAQNMGLE